MNAPQMRPKLRPQDLRRGAPVQQVPGSNLVAPAGAVLSRDGLIEGKRIPLDPALLCPFGATPLHFLLLQGSVRAFGMGWYSRPFPRAELPQLIALCKQRAVTGEKTPATVYLRKDPFDGQELAPVLQNNRFEYRGAFWVSQMFTSSEKAYFWFSIRGGKAPIFGPDVVQTIKDDMERAEDDGEAVRREDQKGMDDAQEYAEDRTKDRRKTIVSQPGLEPKDSRMPGAE